MAQTVGVKAVFDTSQFNAGLKTYVNGMSVAQNVTVNVTKDVNNLNTAFNAGLGAAVGTAAISAINAIGNAVRNLGNEVLDLITRFENLGFTIRSLVASDLVNQGIAGDLAEGLEQAESLAPSLQAQLERIAILSKFDSFEVTSFFQKALIGGFKLNDALVITQDLIDFGAAQGRTPLQLDNILREIGQINIAGKVSGENIRTLRNNSFDLIGTVNRALEGTGKSFEDFKNDGTEVIRLLFSQLEKEVGGSAERIAGSFVGLLSSLRDIRQISLANLFTPVGESVRPQLQELVDLLSSPDFKASLVVIGELLGGVVAEGLRRVTAFIGGAIQAWQALDPAVKQNIAVFLAAGAAFTVLIGGAAALALAIGALVNPFTVAVTALSLFVVGLTDGFQAAQRITATTVNAIADYFTQLVSAAAEWGINIGQAFADGMVQAASVIVQAVNVIGDAISYLMAPGSPPRFLPDIDVWGTETAQVYLDGFTQADFSVLNQVGSSIRGILQNLVDSDQLSKVDVPRLVLGSEQAFSRAIADVRTFGQITEATLESIRQQAGPAADTVLQFAARYAEVVTATDAVTESQEELNRITKSYDALLNPLRDKLQGISNAGEDAREQQKIAALQRILANRGVSDGRKRVAQLEIEEILAKRQVRNLEQQQDAAEDVAQTQLTAAQQAQQEAEAELQLFQSKIQAQTEQTQLQNEFLRLLKEETAESTKLDANIGSIGKSLKKALSPLAKQLKFVQLQKAELQDTIKEAKARAVLADANATAAQKATAELTLQEIALRRQQRILDARELGFSEAELTKLREVPVVLADIGKKGKSAAAGIKGALDLGGAGINEGLLTQFNEKLDETRQRFADIKQQVIDTATTINEKLPDFLKLFPDQEGGEPPIITNLKKYKPIIIAIGLAFVGSKILGSFAALATNLGIVKVAAAKAAVPLAALLSPIGLLALAVGGLALAYYTNFGGITDATIEWYEKQKEIFEGLPDIVEKTKDKISNALDAIRQSVLDFFNLDAEENPAFKKFIENVYLGAAEEATNQNEKLTAQIADEFDQGIKDNFATGEPIIDSLLSTVFRNQAQAATSANKNGRVIGKAIADGVGEGIEEETTLAEKAMGFLVGAIFQTAQTQALIKSPSRLFAEGIGKPIGEGVAEGISEADTDGSIFTFITKIVTAFAGLVTSVVASTAGLVVPVSGVFTLLGTNITTATDTMVLAVNTSYQLMADTINGIVELMAAALKVKFDALNLAVVAITLAMRNAVLIQYQTMDTEVNEAVGVFATGVTTQIETLTEAIVGLFDEMRKGVLGEIETMSDEVLAALGSNGLIGSILKLKDDYRDAGKALGEAMLKGVRDGLRNSKTLAEVISAIDGLAKKIEDRLKDAFNISSPSKLMEDEVGSQIVKGVAVGIKKNEGSAIKAASDMARQTIGEIRRQAALRNASVDLLSTNIDTGNTANAISSLTNSFEDTGQKLALTLAESFIEHFQSATPLIISEMEMLASQIEAVFSDRLSVNIGDKIRKETTRILDSIRSLSSIAANTLQSATAQVSSQTSSFVPASSSSVSNTNNYNLNVSSQASSQGVVSDFRIMEVLATV